jgi:hypothetical protein
MDVQSYGGSTPPPAMIVVYERYDSLNNLIVQFPVVKTYPIGNFAGEQFDSPLIYMNQTDYILVRVNWVTGNGAVAPPKDPVSLELISTGQGGGVFEVYNPEDYIADIYEIEYPMKLSQFKLIKKNSTHKVIANDGRNSISGWIENLVYRRSAGMATIRLIAETGE